tara:strand:- start:22 stop:141 length:120 start_codon:yes stop_codon:yes gene_type:complete
MIYLHKNGVTIVADKKAKVGQTYELNGEKYLSLMKNQRY